MIPNCEIHHKPMRMGVSGTYFCPTLINKLPDGKKIWCTYKILDEAPSPTKTNPSTPQAFQASLETAQEIFNKPAPVIARTETYRIQKQHSQEMSIRFLEYCAKMSLDPAKEITDVERWTKIFQEALDI